ncbi:MAG: DUF6580 family putative transport protein [Bdellovibrionota bacterium]
MRSVTRPVFRLDARFFSLVAIILGAALLRLVPHPANFTPIAAMALFGAAHFKNKYVAVLAPLMALLLSDVVIGFHEQMPAVYLAFIAVSLLGFFFVREQKSVGRIAGASLVGSALFFIITNFAVWMQTAMYPKSGAGLMACYVAALPFLQNSIAGDLMFNGVLFGAAFALAKWFPNLPGRVPAKTKVN